MVQVALFLVAKRFPVGDEKLEIARVRLVHARVVDFVDDAMAEREPDPAARMISGAQAFFGAGGPAGFDSGRAECDGVLSWIHIKNVHGQPGLRARAVEKVAQISNLLYRRFPIGRVLDWAEARDTL